MKKNQLYCPTMWKFACYHSKRDGKNTARVFVKYKDPVMRECFIHFCIHSMHLGATVQEKIRSAVPHQLGRMVCPSGWFLLQAAPSFSAVFRSHWSPVLVMCLLYLSRASP